MHTLKLIIKAQPSWLHNAFCMMILMILNLKIIIIRTFPFFAVGFISNTLIGESSFMGFIVNTTYCSSLSSSPSSTSSSSSWWTFWGTFKVYLCLSCDFMKEILLLFSFISSLFKPFYFTQINHEKQKNIEKYFHCSCYVQKLNLKCLCKFLVQIFI